MLNAFSVADFVIAYEPESQRKFRINSKESSFHCEKIQLTSGDSKIIGYVNQVSKSALRKTSGHIKAGLEYSTDVFYASFKFI